MKEFIDELWEARETLNSESLREPELKKALFDIIDGLDSGRIKALELDNGVVNVNEWIRKALFIFSRTQPPYPMGSSIRCFDGIPLKFDSWDMTKFQTANIIVTLGSVVRKGSFIGGGTLISAGYIDIGVNIGKQCVIGQFSNIGALAHIGDNVIIGANSGIGGSIMPYTEAPCVVDSNCFIGNNCHIGNDIYVAKDCVIQDGVRISRHTPLYNIETDTISYGQIPQGHLVQAGALPDISQKYSISAVILSKI